MDNFEEIFNSLNRNSKKAINAYRNGRQFMVTGNAGRLGIMINERLYPTIIASIVNEVFACELFLKSMIMIKFGKEAGKKHKLLELYEQLDDKEIKECLPQYNFDDELQKINDAFTVCRYSYEYESLQVYMGFIFDLCDVLEKNNKKRILKAYKLDMEKSFIWFV